MSWPNVYLLLPGTAREALGFYRAVFGGDLEIHDYAEFGRTDGPEDAVAHGVLSGRVALMMADAGAGEDAVAATGIMLSVLGEEPDLLRGWFAALAEGGRVLDDLQQRAWGDWDGTVRDRFGLTWLIGFRG